MTTKSTVWFASLVLLTFRLAVCSFAQSDLNLQSGLSMVAAPAAVSPLIDGKLDDTCWASAAVARDFKRNDGRGLAKHQTVVRLCYDKENLYIAFECLEPEADKLDPHEKADDGPVWHDDCVELFISPRAYCNKENFHHFAVNSAGYKAYLYSEVPKVMSAQWKAAASRTDGKWCAEMLIPFKLLEPIGTNDAHWRIQFAREDFLHAESSTWSEVAQSFSSFWRFGKLLQPADGPQFVHFRGEMKPLKSSGIGKGVHRITVDQYVEQNPVIIPEPRIVKYANGQFTITPKTRILIGKSADPMDRRPAEEINDELKLVAGFTLPIEVVESANVSTKNCIIVGERALNSASDAFCIGNGMRLTASFPGKEGYAVEVGNDAVLVAGSDRLGTFWGAQTFKQLIRRASTGTAAYVTCLSVRDWPRFEYRGVHLLATPDALDFHGQMIEKILSRYKVNNILLQAETVAWESHPETARPDRAMPKDDVRKLIAIAKDHHITVTPLIQSLGHVNWAFNGGKNVEIAEDPKALYAYCPINPEAHEFIGEILTEAIELFGKPEYVHVGLDEFDMRGEFPYHEECKKIGKEQLYIDETVRLHDFLKARGVKTMMWGDILTKPGFAAKIDQLPRDILICDWRYGNKTEYPTLDFYIKNGFKTVGCTWYLPINNYHFSKVAYERGIYGMMKTTWTGFQLKDKVLKDMPYDVYSNIMGAAWAWSPGTPTLEKMQWEPDQVFYQVWYTSESKPVGSWAAVDLAPYCNVSLRDTKTRLGWLGMGEENDLSGMPVGVAVFCGVPYNLGSAHEAILLDGPERILGGFGTGVKDITVNTQANRLHFLHTSAYADQGNRKVGEYVIRYSDGSSEKVDIAYGVNIMAWDVVRQGSRTMSAWRGATASGDVVRVNSFTWDNPHPEKVISSFDFISVGGQACPVLIAVTTEVGE